MDSVAGVRRAGRVAIVDCAKHGGEFAGLAATLDQLRFEDVRAVVLDTAGMALDGRDSGESALLGRAVLPLIAAWTGAPTLAALAVGLFSDIRVGDASLALDVSQVSMAGGPVAARMALLVGTRLPQAVVVTADVALRSGLVSANAGRPGEALAAAARIAEAIAKRGPVATQLAKEAVWRGLPMPLEQGLRFETDLTLLLQTTKDRDEGVRAFLEKRPPEFEGV